MRWKEEAGEWCETRAVGGEGEGGGGRRENGEGGRGRRGEEMGEGKEGSKGEEYKKYEAGWYVFSFKKKPVFLGTINYTSNEN